MRDIVSTMINSDDTIRMTAEVGRGVAKSDSAVANKSAEHGASWDRLVVQVGEISAAGYIVDPSKEISDPAAYDTVTGTYAV